MEGKAVPMETIQALASIPALPVLQAQVLGTMLAPITGLAFVLKQIAEQQGAPAEAAAEAPAETAAESAEAPAPAAKKAPARKPARRAAAKRETKKKGTAGKG